jgi:transposase-like protein
MQKSDVVCCECGAGFRRLELSSQRGEKGEYRCPACHSRLEIFDGSKLIAYRLTIEPSIRAVRD